MTVDERRDSYRFPLTAGLASARGPAGLAALEVRELSASGGRLAVRGPLRGDLDAVPFDFKLGPYPVFRSQVAPVRVAAGPDGWRQIGIRFRELPRPGIRSLAQFLVERFLLREPEEPTLRRSSPAEILAGPAVARHLRAALVQQGRPLSVSARGRLLPLQLRVVELADASRPPVLVAAAVAGGVERLRSGRRHEFAFPGANSVNRFRARVWPARRGQVAIALPSRLEQSGFRGSVRAQLRPDAPVELRLIHPRVPRLQLSKPVVDVGGQGLSFPLDPAQDLLCPGERIEELLVRLPAGEVSAEAVVRSMMQRPGAAHVTCGVELVAFHGPAQAERWRRFVFHAAHERLRLGTTDDVPAIWSVLEASRYLELVQPDRRASASRQFFVSWSEHAGAANLSQVFVATEAGRPLGTIAASRVYPRTWLVHHLGVDEGFRRTSRRRFARLAREMYSGMIYILEHLTSEFFVTYIDADKPFNDLIYGAFLQQHSAPEDFVWDRFTVYRVRAGRPEAPAEEPATAATVTTGSAGLVDGLAEHLARTRPAVEVAAMAYARPEIELEAFGRECAAQGYERQRRLFFARKAGRPRAALIAETGEPGLNLFGLLDKCWLVPLDGTRAVGPGSRAALLRRAQAWYRAAGREEFLLLGDAAGEPAELVATLGLERVAAGRRWLARREILPPWLNYLQERLEADDG